MKAIEAIQHLKWHFDGHTAESDTIEAAILAFEALEKQVPQEPKAYKGYEGQCPNCNAAFLDRSTKYCGNCGQALDWSVI